MPFYDTKCVFSQVRKSISEENSIYDNLLLRNLTKKTSMESTLQYLSRQSIAIIQVHEEKKTASILNTMKNKIIHGKSPGDLMKNVNFRNPKE